MTIKHAAYFSAAESRPEHQIIILGDDTPQLNASLFAIFTAASRERYHGTLRSRAIIALYSFFSSMVERSLLY